jgi:tetratricopeptide (TPR) repeat protein
VRGAVVTGAATAALLVALSFAKGGYFPEDWGLLLVGFALAALAGLLSADRLELGRLDLLLLGGLTGLALWAFLSAAWAPAADGPVLEGERGLVYVAAAAALQLLVRRERIAAMLAGVLSGVLVVALFGLSTRLLPGLHDAVPSGARLDEPIGYANALGILAAVGMLLAFGFALRARAEWRAAAAAALVPLAAVLQLTGSRGAVLALAMALVVLVVVEQDRLRSLGGVLLLAPAPALAAVVVARSRLSEPGLTPDEAEATGLRVLLALTVLALLSAAAALAAPALARRVAPVAFAALVFAAVAGGVWAALGGTERAFDEFRAPPPVTQTDLDRHLLSFSGSWRADYWRVAWGMVEREPLLGEGGGSYERWWLEERPVPSYARDAHSLYLETLAELGPVGLALLLVALVSPLVALRGARGDAPAAAAAAAYVAFLVHAGLDWDWEVPVVTLPALACAVALLALARRDGEVIALSSWHRWAAAALVALVAALGIGVHVGNRAAGAAENALAQGDLERAATDARRARSWMPWAARPWRLEGEARLAARRDTEALRSLREAARRDPSSWLTWYDLAQVSAGEERRDALERASRLNPLGPEVAELRTDS